MTIRQVELDLAEEYILKKLFGDVQNLKVGNKVKLFLISQNINLPIFINEKLQVFETITRDFMTEAGYIDGSKISKILAIKNPVFNEITLPNIKPIELVQIIDQVVNFEKIGHLIQNF